MISNLWRWISYIGVKEIPDRERRSVIILNRINFFIIVVSLLAFLATVIFSGIMFEYAFGVGTIRLLLMAVSGIASMLLTRSHHYLPAKLITTLYPGFFLIILPTLFGDVGIEYYFYYPFAATAMGMIPILLFPKREERPTMILLLICCFLLAVTSDNLLSYFSPTHATPAIFAGRYFYYKIAQVLLFSFVILTVLALRELNIKYENLLGEQNEVLSARKEELILQAEELKSINEKLNRLNTDLASSHQELGKYKNRLEELVENRTAALKESESRFRSIFENANDAIFIMMNDTYVNCNLKTSEIFGTPRDQIIGRTPDQFSPSHQPDGSDSRENAAAKIREALNGNSQRFEWKHMRADGALFDAEVSLNRIELGGKLFLLAIVRDITARKKIEQDMLEYEGRLQNFVDSLTDYIYTVKIKNGKLIEIEHGEGCLAVTGYTSQEFRADPLLWKAMVTEESYLIVKAQSERLIKGLKSSPVEHFLIHKDGSRKWVRNIQVRRTNVPEGYIILDGLISDITERKRMEEALRESENKFRNIFEKGKNGIIIIDANLKILLANQLFAELSGYSVDDPNQLFVSDIIFPEQHNIVKERLARVAKGEDIGPYEYKARYKDGSMHYIESYTSVMDYFGQKAFLVILRDITYFKDAERKLTEAIINTEENERSRIAQDLHDGLGPVLSTIKLYFQVFKETKNQSKKVMLSEKLDSTIQEAIKGISEISHNISPHVLKNYGFYAALKQFIYRITLTNVVHIELDCGSELPLNQNTGIILYRAISELINNSIKHAQCKTITITMQQVDGFIYVDYSDDGKGFDVEKATNKDAKGSGLQNILNRIKALQGTTDLNSFIGSGMSALLRIPL
jgi:PAS domain S-box-containing protein